MDNRGFDELVRCAANVSGTRRGALLGVLAALAGGVGVAEGRKSCASGLTRCKVGKKKRCVNLTTDPEHCGTCGAACAAGKTCQGGVCTSSCTPSCDGRQCGDDGCGGLCGQCGGGGRCRDGRCLEPEDECSLDDFPCVESIPCCNPESVCVENRCSSRKPTVPTDVS